MVVIHLHEHYSYFQWSWRSSQSALIVEHFKGPVLKTQIFVEESKSLENVVGSQVSSLGGVEPTNMRSLDLPQIKKFNWMRIAKYLTKDC